LQPHRLTTQNPEQPSFSKQQDKENPKKLPTNDTEVKPQKSAANTQKEGKT